MLTTQGVRETRAWQALRRGRGMRQQPPNVEKVEKLDLVATPSEADTWIMGGFGGISWKRGCLSIWSRKRPGHWGVGPRSQMGPHRLRPPDRPGGSQSRHPKTRDDQRFFDFRVRWPPEKSLYLDRVLAARLPEGYGKHATGRPRPTLSFLDR